MSEERYGGLGKRRTSDMADGAPTKRAKQEDPQTPPRCSGKNLFLAEFQALSDDTPDKQQDTGRWSQLI